MSEGEAPAPAKQAAFARKPRKKKLEPLRLKTLTLCNFRGFPGPSPSQLDIGGKNLLIYGENGAGKSSIFHALNEFFSVEHSEPAQRKSVLDELKNKYKKTDDKACYVEVEFANGKGSVRWDETRHPVDITTKGTGPSAANPRVVEAALRKAFFDYRSLLETNFRHGNDAINLFEVTVSLLLRDFPATSSESDGKTIFELWQDAHVRLERGRGFTARHRSVYPNFNRRITQIVTDLNAAIRIGLGELTKVNAASGKNPANQLLAEMGWKNLKLDSFPVINGARFQQASKPAERKILPGTITPKLVFENIEFPTPQNAINEARLSALALAIYLAGREICTNALGVEPLRLMVLDDVLMGLDQSNRKPILDLLQKRFAGKWQIILLTHDRVWFEMARMTLGESEWKAVEMFERISPEGFPVPLIVPGNCDAVAHNLEKATKFHGDSEYSAAALHARMALELSLKKVCDRQGVEVPFKLNKRHLSLGTLLNCFGKWNTDAGVAAEIKKLELARSVVLNPFSHSTPVTLGKADVLSGIDAVKAFHSKLKDLEYYKKSRS
jgi:energy-coupling factor transporter ATP-binding protein EcfA2